MPYLRIEGDEDLAVGATPSTWLTGRIYATMTRLRPEATTFVAGLTYQNYEE
jgi:hypothetical protein